MANKRMFSLQIVDSDAFLDMPLSSQLLYFHLSMRADDEGFVGNPKRIMKSIGSNEDDFKVLVSKRFVIVFESGVLVIKHWLIHNTIRMDRFGETAYRDEKSLLTVKDNKAYTLDKDGVATIRQPNDNQRLPQVKLSKDNISKDKIERKETPSQTANSFFSQGERYTEIRSSLLERIPEEVLDRELEKFVSYWTEPNKSGTRVRWEQQETFDVRRRLQTWFSRVETTFKKQASRGRGFVQ